ncbi:MAG: hypothetical protein P8012_03115 [Desulfobacterales bacterium]
MRKIILVLFAVVFIGAAFYSVGVDAQMGPGYGYGYGMGPGMMGPGYGYGMGPGMMGHGYGPGYGMGPGMMGPGYGYGYGMGPGMMGPGYGYGRQYGPQYGRQYQEPQEPLDQDQAKQEVENYLSSLRNPNLKLGKIEEKGNNYQFDIETKNGSLVDKLLVNKYTGWMRSAY